LLCLCVSHPFHSPSGTQKKTGKTMFLHCFPALNNAFFLIFRQKEIPLFAVF